MSHFTCLVIGPDHEKQLQPFHEFECTGIDDEYVVDVDRTAEAREEFKSHTRKMARNDTTGETVCAYDDRFYRDPTPDEVAKHGPMFGWGFGGGISWTSKDWGDGLGYRTKVHEVPRGWTVVEVPASERGSFAEFIKGWYGGEVLRPGEARTEEHKCGFVEVDDKGEVVRFIARTNPNKQWDWWEIGGRWTGFFPLKKRAHGRLGKPGLMTKPARRDTADQARKGDIDFGRARREAEKHGAKKFDAWARCFEGQPQPKPWSSFVERVKDESEPDYGIERAREDYAAQPAIARWNAHTKEQRIFSDSCPVDDYGFDRDVYLRRCRNQALVPFAIVKDGVWLERGAMGWWGVVHGEMDKDRWADEVQRIYDDLPDDTILTLVDCHI